MRKTLIRTLHLHQKWRRGGKIQMQSPKDIGLALDACIRILRKLSDEQVNDILNGKKNEKDIA